MSKQIAVTILLFILIGGAAAYFLSGKPNTQKTAAVAAVTPTPTQAPANMLTWTDLAGFSFKYPEGTNIDNHPDDTKNYANLTLTLPSKNIVNVVMADNTYKNLDVWAGENSAIDATLDGRPAKKILKDDLQTIASIDNGVLVTITGQDIADTVKTWTFIYPSPTTAKSAPASDNGGDVLEEQ